MSARGSAHAAALTRAHAAGAVLLLCALYAVAALPLQLNRAPEGSSGATAAPPTTRPPGTPATPAAHAPAAIPGAATRPPPRSASAPATVRPPPGSVRAAPAAASEGPSADVTRVDERWRAEPEDAEWTNDQWSASEALLDAFGAPPEALLEVRCHATVCRVLLDAGDIGRLAALGRHAQRKRYPIALQPQGEDGLQLVAYLPRAGFEAEVLGLDPERPPADPAVTE